MIQRNSSFMDVFAHPFDPKFRLLKDPKFREETSTKKSRGSIVEVSVEDLYPSQGTMNGNIILEYIIAINNGKALPPAEGIKLGDRIYILNGHHRVAANIILGNKTVEMSVVNMSNSEAK